MKGVVYMNILKKLLTSVLSIAILVSCVGSLSANAAEVDVEGSEAIVDVEASGIDWYRDVSHRELPVTYMTHDQNMRYNQLNYYKRTYKNAKLSYKYSVAQEGGSYGGEFYCGDIDKNGYLSPEDVDLYISLLNGTSTKGLTVFGGITGGQSSAGTYSVDPRYDVNRDGVANWRDARDIAGYIACGGNYYSPITNCCVGKKYQLYEHWYYIKSGNKTLVTNTYSSFYKLKSGSSNIYYSVYGNANNYNIAIDW